MRNTKFEELPKNVQDEIRNILKAYDRVVVWFENGRYEFGSTLKSKYAEDHRYIGTYNKNDLYSETEQIENYINEFHCYPKNYKGKRDYSLMRRMDEERSKNIEIKGKINENGDFEIA